MKYSFESPIRFSEVDPDAVLSIPALINYFQDAVSLQSESLGIGTHYLREKGQGWLLLTWQIEINELPGIAERVKTTTWGYAFRKMMAYRNYTMTGETGNLYAYAASQWLLFDFRNMKPVNIPEEDQRLYDPEPALDMNYDPGKIRASGDIPFRIPGTFRVEPYHLDTNHHMNNVQYIQLAMSMVPDIGRIRKLRAEYRKQALLGDLIIPKVWEQGPVTIISLEDEEGKPCCSVELTTRTQDDARVKRS